MKPGELECFSDIPPPVTPTSSCTPWDGQVTSFEDNISVTIVLAIRCLTEA